MLTKATSELRGPKLQTALKQKIRPPGFHSSVANSFRPLPSKVDIRQRLVPAIVVQLIQPGVELLAQSDKARAGFRGCATLECSWLPGILGGDESNFAGGQNLYLVEAEQSDDA